jgi:hypothetical protein
MYIPGILQKNTGVFELAKSFRVLTGRSSLPLENGHHNYHVEKNKMAATTATWEEIKWLP